MEIVKGSLSELKHDFNGNIRNQKNIIQGAPREVHGNRR
jgi:hypothetical protein